LYLLFSSPVVSNMANGEVRHEVTKFLALIKDEFEEDINIEPTLESLSMLDDWVLRRQVYRNFLTNNKVI